MIKNRLGYIARYGDIGNGYRFEFMETSYTRKISSQSDLVYSKILYPIDYTDVKTNTEIMMEDGVILVGEPFFLDDNLREKSVKWVEFANSLDPYEYDHFFGSEKQP